MEKYSYVLAMIQKLQSLKVEKTGQILCVKKVPFCKSGHILGLVQGANTCCSSLSHSLYLGPSTVIQCYLDTIPHIGAVTKHRDGKHPTPPD